MRKKLCCPKCQSENLIFPENKREFIICKNCRFEFDTVENLTESIVKMEKTFNSFTCASILFLLVSVILMIIFVFMDYHVDSVFASFFIHSLGMTKTTSFVAATFFLLLSLISLICLFDIRKEIGRMKNIRRFVRKRGIKSEDNAKLNT